MAILRGFPPSFEQPEDFSRFCVTAFPGLRKHQFPVHRHIENASGGFHHHSFHVGEFPPQLGRQTGGPGFIVSNDAILDGHFHWASRSIGWSRWDES
jgi:hypothetical protein